MRPGLILLWAFWFSSAADGWVVMPTREACETARVEILAMAASETLAPVVSGCHALTPEEVEQRRHKPPTDTSQVPFGCC